MSEDSVKEFAEKSYPELEEAWETDMAKVEAFNKAMDMLYESMYGDKPTTDR